MKVGVLALQGDVREHCAVLAGMGIDPIEVRLADELSDVDGLVMPGGESTTISKLLVRFGLQEPLSDRLADGMPLFGTCAGLILMASEVVDVGDKATPESLLRVLDVAVRRNAYGSQVQSFEASLDVAGLDSPVEAAFIRAPSIERVGDEVEVLATCDGRPVLVRQGRLMGAAFHPEISGDPRVHEIFVESI